MTKRNERFVDQATQKPAVNAETTALTKARYDRNAPLYDFFEGFMERLSFSRWRPLVWQAVGNGKILEVGVGTGKNMPYYPDATQITAIDLSEKMLARARRRVEKLGSKVELIPMDAQALSFPDASFDHVVTTFVFCSVPDPVLGFREIKRVLRPDGRAVFLEHMRPESQFLGRLFDWLNPFIVRLSGANINRRTLENIKEAGLVIERAERLTAQGIVQLIIARAGERGSNQV